MPPLFAVALLCFAAVSLHADQISPLGSASSFAVLGATTVTNTGSTVLSGNLGVAPGSAVTGFVPGVVTNGNNQQNDALSILAHKDAATGYQALAALTSTANLSGKDLGGLRIDARSLHVLVPLLSSPVCLPSTSEA